MDANKHHLTYYIMRNFESKWALFIASICVINIFFFTSCSKKGSNPTPSNNTPALAITSLNINHGPYNTAVIITGVSFNSDPTNDLVFFNGKAATVTAATSTSLTVTVPVGAGTGNVTVNVGGKTVSGPMFTYELTAVVSTLAGSGAIGSTNGVATAASFDSPEGITMDASGNLYVADFNNNIIRKITSSGVVTTVAGSGSQGSVDGIGTSASFNGPTGLAVDGSGNLYVADNFNSLIRKISPAGVVTTLAGNGSLGAVDGTGVAASFFGPSALVVDASGNLYVTDSGNNLIRKVTQTGVVSTFAGSGTSGSINGVGIGASFFDPYALTIDIAGNLYVTDENNHLIRKITPTGTVTTFAGNGLSGFTDGMGTSASFTDPVGVVVDGEGNLYVADGLGSRIRKITSTGVVSTIAGNGIRGSVNGPGATSEFTYPRGVAVDNAGSLYISDQATNLIRKIQFQ